MRKCLLFFTLSCFALLFNACGDDSDDIVNDIELPTISLSQKGEFNDNTVTVLVSPALNTVKYEYILATEEDRSAFEAGNIEGIHVVENGEAAEYTFTDLAVNTERTLFARPYDAEGRSGAVASLRLDTYTGGREALMHAEAKMISAEVASFEFTIDELIYMGAYCIAEPGRLEDFRNDQVTQAESFSEIAARAHSRYDLTPETDYAFYMKGYNRLDELVFINEIPFTTLASDEISAVSMDLKSIDAYSVFFDLIPNDNTSKMIASVDVAEIIPASISEQWRDNFVGMFESWGATNWNDTMIEEGGNTLEVNVTDPSMVLGVTCNVYVLSYDKDNRPSNFQVFSYTKPAFDPSLSKATMSATVAPLTNGGTFTVTPSADALAVYLSLYTKAYYDELIEFGEFTDELFIDDVITRGTYGNDGYFRYGNGEFVITNTDEAIEPGTELILLGVPVNMNGLEGKGDLYTLDFTSAL